MTTSPGSETASVFSVGLVGCAMASADLNWAAPQSNFDQSVALSLSSRLSSNRRGSSIRAPGDVWRAALRRAASAACGSRV